MKNIFWIALFLAQTTFGATIVIPASKDNTLYEDVDGSLSNGAGEFLYVGATGPIADNVVRRGLMAFDIASAIPAGAIIENVSLSLYFINPKSNDPIGVTLHALTANWGEGTSNAGETGGAGDSREPGDATWLHRSFGGDLWDIPGGDFIDEESALTTVGVFGRYNFSGPRVLDDVRNWHASPETSFGWILIGDEEASATARRVGSRENSVPSQRPALTISYTIPEPGTAGLLFGGACCLLTRPPRCRRSRFS